MQQSSVGALTAGAVLMLALGSAGGYVFRHVSQGVGRDSSEMTSSGLRDDEDVRDAVRDASGGESGGGAASSAGLVGLLEMWKQWRLVPKRWSWSGAHEGRGIAMGETIQFQKLEET